MLSVTGTKPATYLNSRTYLTAAAGPPQVGPHQARELQLLLAGQVSSRMSPPARAEGPGEEGRRGEGMGDGGWREREKKDKGGWREAGGDRPPPPRTGVACREDFNHAGP